MTTKKQRRANVAEKRAAYDEETKRLGLAALERSRRASRQVSEDAERATRSKRTALQMRKKHEALPQNLSDSLLSLDIS